MDQIGLSWLVQATDFDGFQAITRIKSPPNFNGFSNKISRHDALAIPGNDINHDLGSAAIEILVKYENYGLLIKLKQDRMFLQ